MTNIHLGNTNYLRIGQITCLITFIIGIGYILVTTLGFLSLESHYEPIGDPYFTLMEFLTLLIAPLMVINMMSVREHAATTYSLQSHFAVYTMLAMAIITSGVHAVILILRHQLDPGIIDQWQIFFSFKWPSVVYILDILAWDWFFALSFLFAAPIFQKGKEEKRIGILMFIAGLLSLIGLLGVPFGNMQIRNIGIIGYAIFTPFVFLLISLYFRKLGFREQS